MMTRTLLLCATLAACGGGSTTPAAGGGTTPPPPADTRTAFERRLDDACLAVGKRLSMCALEDASARLEAGEVLGLRADWTRPDRAIADYLASFGRYGIPFNVVYGPGAPTGIALPELLNSEDVLAALDQAAQPGPPGVAGGS